MSEKLIDTSAIRQEIRDFNRERVGTDVPLAVYNTPEYLVYRGLIGESTELLDAMEHGSLSDVYDEYADIIIFAISLAERIHLSDEELNNRLAAKLARNRQKYDPKFFEGRPVREALALARSEWRPEHKGLHSE